MIGCVFNGKTRISARLCLKLSCMHLIIYEINAERWKKKPGKHFLHSTYIHTYRMPVILQETNPQSIVNPPTILMSV